MNKTTIFHAKYNTNLACKKQRSSNTIYNTLIIYIQRHEYRKYITKSININNEMNKIVITRILFSIILYNMICTIKYYFHLTKKDSYLEIQKIMKL